MYKIISTQDISATKIQAVFRGHVGRKSVEAKQWLQSQIVNLTGNELRNKLSDLLVDKINTYKPDMVKINAILSHPTLDVNAADSDGRTPLYMAS